MNEIKKLLMTGGSLRYRPPHGFYVVRSGLTIPVSQSEAQAAVKAGRVRPAGISAHGVYVFSLNDKATDVRRVRNHPQALPTRPAAVPDALPRVHLLRGAADPKNSARIQMAGGEKAAAVPSGVGGMGGQGAQRDGIEKACKGECVGCGGEGVMA